MSTKHDYFPHKGACMVLSLTVLRCNISLKKKKNVIFERRETSHLSRKKKKIMLLEETVVCMKIIHGKKIYVNLLNFIIKSKNLFCNFM